MDNTNTAAVATALLVALVVATAEIGDAIAAAVKNLNSSFSLARGRTVFATVALADFAAGDKAWRLEALQFAAEQFGGEYGFSRLRGCGTVSIPLPSDQAEIVDLYRCLEAALTP